MVQNAGKLLCLTLFAYILSVAIANAASTNQVLDKRVTESMNYTHLVHPDPWETDRPPVDWIQRGGFACGMSSPGDDNARRAQNLAATKHFAEAIAEWTRAIDCYDDDIVHRFGMSYSIDPEWLLNRARLYLKVGRTEDALADVERSLTFKRSSDQQKFNAAVLLTELGKYSRGEEVARLPSSVHSSFSPSYSYLLAVLQQKQGKKELAKQTFKQAATLFAAAGLSPPAQACLDEITVIDARNTLKIANLEPPRSNYENIERLFQALATRSDVFDIDALNGLIGAASFSENKTGNAHFKEISLTIDIPDGGGKRLNINMDPFLCSINQSALKGLLKDSVEVPETWRKEVAYSVGYKVPAGTLVLSIHNGGFNSIWRAQLYSKDATFPEPKKPANKNITAGRKAFFRHARVGEALEFGDVEEVQKVVAEWLHDDPEDPRAHMFQAEILSKKGDLDSALAAIDTAIKYSVRDKVLNSQDTGNVLLIRKGSYLLEQRKFEEAYSIFEQAFPAKPSDDLLLLRARAEIGLKKLTDATNDLKEASKKFYDECRIVRRDEAEKLLDSIRGEASIAPQQTVQLSTKSKRAPGAIKDEGAKAGRLVHQLELEKQQRESAKVKRDQDSIEKATRELILSAPHKKSKPGAYILALLHMSGIAARLGQKSSAQNYLDKAIDSYQTYTPQPDYDACTRALINDLTICEGSQFQERVEKVARMSELFCTNETFRQERDRTFTDLSRHGDANIAMLEKLIEIREELHSKTGVSLAESPYLRLPKNYKGKGQYKELADYFVKSRVFIDSPNPAAATMLAASEQAMSQVEQVLECIHARDFSKSESLIDSLEQAKLSCPESLNNAILSSQHLAIADGYLEQSDTKLADTNLRKAISTPLADQVELSPMVGLLSKFRTVYEDSEQFQTAESLYGFALNKLAKISTKDSAKSIAEIKMSLAEILLDHERHLSDKRLAQSLKRKANGLFEECIHATTNQVHDAGSTVADLQLRRTFATKYPALVKLDIPNGEVFYEEHGRRPGSRGGGIADGRKFMITGPHSLVMRGNGNGRMTLLLDGETLTDKALIQLDKGDLATAENLLTSALRADADSAGFGFLSECWYLQGKAENALQASSMALEIDSRNAHAAAMKRLCINDLRRPEETNRETENVLNAAASSNSAEKPITVAICRMALGKSRSAVEILSDVLKKEPASYRASTFKSKCQALQPVQ